VGAQAKYRQLTDKFGPNAATLVFIAGATKADGVELVNRGCSDKLPFTARGLFAFEKKAIDMMYALIDTLMILPVRRH